MLANRTTRPIRINSMQPGAGGIGEQGWEASAGGESAFLAFDPDDPRYVMGGSYLGTIEVLDTHAAAGTGIMAAPIQYLGRAARDMKYLFNWNAPIIWSQHEANTFYHAAQILLRTRDLGQTWEEVSPDLTGNHDNKQGKGGGPLTVEAVGAENYGTISYVAESPHEKGVIWTGSDDGLVYLTRDNCATWTNVTPTDLEECLINCIEVSPHDPATAYIATTRYKFNDKRPALYKTDDYGKNWTRIDSGIPDGSFTRVVREDTEIAGLLLAGTETGIYLSTDAGQSWQPFQLNLPMTPVLDLLVRHNDIIVATSGRSFWILDDLGLVRQLSVEPIEPAGQNPIRLYAPEPAVLSNHGSQLNGDIRSFDGQNSLTGVNPANGIVVYYELPELGDDEEIQLEIHDQQGQLVNKYSSAKDESFERYAGGPPASPVVDKRPGLNRFVWDMRYATMPGIPKAYIEGSYRGHKAIPGTYQLTLRYGDHELRAECEILANPLYDVSQSDYTEFHEFMSGMELTLTNMHEKTNRLYQVQLQLKKLLSTLADDEKFKSLHESGMALIAKLEAWDQEMVQRLSKAYDDVENHPNKFTAEYLFLINQTESALPSVTRASRRRRDELDAQWKELELRVEKFFDKEIPEFNQLLWKNQIGALWQGRGK